MKFGEGGEDSKLFVSQLFSAYTKYAARLGFRADVLDADSGHIVAKIVGKGVFRAFRSETGQHACQRIPHTERRGRHHTSIVSVAVLPIKQNVCKPLPKEELEVTPQMCRLRSGGQNAQRNATAIRAIHLPTKISVFIQNERSQKQNMEEALRILAARVNDARQAGEDREYREFKRTQLGDGQRGSKVRTYNFRDSRAVDHRNGKKTSKIDEVMNGRFELLMDC